ncbi:hypothetical protein [Solimicrobium silvestre]|nr:hypothetical protein [Solimicrobium silvestre]
MTQAEWLQSIGYGIATVVAGFSIWSYFYSQKKQRELDMVKFSIELHRRLFDDEDLKEILNLIDGTILEQASLEEFKMGSKKRKFITFFEEMSLLVRAKFISEDFALYMFGYYAMQAKDNKHFMNDDMSDERVDFGIFFDFAESYRAKESTLNPSKILITHPSLITKLKNRLNPFGN